MTDRRVPISVLSAVFDVSRSVDRLGTGLFLYVLLVRHAGLNGTVIRTRARLSQELGVAEDRIDTWLSRLVHAGLVRVLSPMPCLVARLVSWPGTAARERENPSHSGSVSEADTEKDHSNCSHRQSSGNTAMAFGDGGAGEGALARLARGVLGSEIEAELPAILAHHSADHVARVLERVRDTPPEKIRKSKLALFRYLIVKTDRHL